MQYVIFISINPPIFYNEFTKAACRGRIVHSQIFFRLTEYFAMATFLKNNWKGRKKLMGNDFNNSIYEETYELRIEFLKTDDVEKEITKKKRT